MSRIRETLRIFQRARVVPLFLAVLAAGCACGDSPVLSPNQSPDQSPVQSPVQAIPSLGSSIPVSAALGLNPGLLPLGATASYPEFDGDTFSAVLPVHLQETELPASLVLDEIAPVLRAAGFVRSLAELQLPDGALALPPPDVSALAGEVCHEAALQQGGAREVCAALSSGGPPSAAAEAAMGEAYGMSVAEFRSELELPVLQYSFPQLVGGVPIDGAGAYAYRRQGESLSTVHGTLFNRYAVVNRPAGGPAALLETARRRLGERWGAGLLELLDQAELVMLPYGVRQVEGGEVTVLRHAWRVLLRSPGTRESWMAWIDAETGALLRALPQQDDAVAVKGERWRRDPGLCKPGDPPCTEVVPFQVSETEDGERVLALDGVFERFDRLGNEGDKGYTFEDDEVATAAADFTQVTGDPAKAVCQSDNTAFRQVHAYSHLYSFRRMLLSAGSMPPFPEVPITVWIDYSTGNRALYDGFDKGQSLMLFMEGPGFVDAQCPDAPKLRLNGAHDAGTLTHEMSHLGVKRLQERRPKGWCRPPAGAQAACPQPEGRGLFHDFADAMANAYTSTNCFSGWTDKNAGVADANRYCKDPATTSERGGFPRLAQAADVFDPDHPGDHYPEHHSGENVSDYADGQIAAAALWRVREGMRSKSPAAGTVEYWVRLNRALWSFGFVRPVCSQMKGENEVARTCVLDLNRYLQDLERRLVEQWAGAPKTGATGRHTANKVLSGFARAGVFLTLHQCLDKPTKTSVSCFVAGQSAGDAVIDVDDRDPGDDPVVDGVTHVEVDTLKRSGPAPLFRVWTGPRYHFEKTVGGIEASTNPPYLCHARFQVEAASDQGFTKGLWKSAVLSAPDCQGEVELPASAWGTLKGGPRIYYRVRTWDAANGNPRISTSPGAGAFNVPPPFVVVNDTGKP